MREELVASEPDRFFAPTPSASGVFGDWIGIYLDTDGERAVDWQEIAAIVEDAYRLRAPQALIAALDRRSPTSREWLSDTRRRELVELRSSIQRWASTEQDVLCVVLVGSWARDAARPDSDVDVVVVTEADRYTGSEDWITDAVGQPAELIRTGDWGALIERRVRLASGLEVEFGFVSPSWASVDPVDPGTRRVISDGCEIWYDPSAWLAQLVAVVGQDGRNG